MNARGNGPDFSDVPFAQCVMKAQHISQRPIFCHVVVANVCHISAKKCDTLCDIHRTSCTTDDKNETKHGLQMSHIFFLDTDRRFRRFQPSMCVVYVQIKKNSSHAWLFAICSYNQQNISQRQILLQFCGCISIPRPVM